MEIKDLFRLILVICVFFSQDTVGQDKQAEKLVMEGNNHYSMGRFNKAEESYRKALQVDNDNTSANFHLGVVLMEVDNKWDALPYLEKAYENDPQVDEQIDFYLGLAYQYNYDFDKALHHFKKAKETPANYNKLEWEELNLHLKQTEFSLKLQESAQEYIVENMGPGINSPFREHAPLIAPTQDKIIFASNRREKVRSDQQQGKYFMDLYVFSNQTDNQEPVRTFAKTLNTMYDDMALSFDDEGKYLLVYNNANFGDIFISEFVNGQWRKPVSLGNNINTTEYTESSASLSSDGTTLFFTSNRRGGLGGSDIYISQRDESGNWGKARNLGDNINSKGNEETPFITADGKILFFSSDGHPGVGGFDIFYSVKDKENGTWSKPENIGFPVNTPQNDVNFVLTKDGLTGYYSSTQSNTLGGEDIYKITLANSKEENTIASVLYDRQPTAIAAAGASEADEKAEEAIMDQLKEVQSEIVSSGKGSSGSVRFKTTNLLRNVYFPMNEKSLDPATVERMDKIAAYMQENPDVKLEVSGHTDDIGSESYNINLSKERAETVVEYLVNKGIDPSRVQSKGLGKSKPLASNDDEDEGRELNRRVEFKLIDP